MLDGQISKIDEEDSQNQEQFAIIFGKTKVDIRTGRNKIRPECLDEHLAWINWQLLLWKIL